MAYAPEDVVEEKWQVDDREDNRPRELTLVNTRVAGVVNLVRGDHDEYTAGDSDFQRSSAGVQKLNSGDGHRTCHT